MNSNRHTLRSYENNIQAYIDGTVQQSNPVFTEWLDRAMESVSKDGRILEIGSAFGRDADYLESKGYAVERTDAVCGFVDFMRQLGKEARLLNLLKDDLEKGTYDMVIALAVFVHFNNKEINTGMRKVVDALLPSGIFAFSVIQGEGERWSSHKLDAPRYFNYYSKEGIMQLLKKYNLELLEMSTGLEEKWLLVTARKRT